ncbi:MAG: Rieske 2Fe-2S domain-containing protein, partial [Candidatus Hodarchaeales archaeon]
MIPNQWYAILESKEVKKGKVIGVTRLGEKLAFWRTGDGEVHCIADKCIHRGVQLSKGKVKDHHLECPFHGFQYDESGSVKVIPALGKSHLVKDYFKQKVYPTAESGGLIFIYWGEWPQDLSELPPIPMFEELLDKQFSYSTKYDHWNVHYSLVIENQLDVVHLPFVHASSIGRGYKTLVYNVKDDGKTLPLKQSEIPKDLKTYLYFRFPNIWINRISSSTIIFIAFA